MSALAGIRERRGVSIWGAGLILWGIISAASNIKFVLDLSSESPMDWELVILAGLGLLLYAAFAPPSVRLEARRLKRDAREIRRRWPQSEFVKSPLNRRYWSPLPGVDPSTDINKAIDWHDRFERLTKGAWAPETSGDFDGTMEYLDWLEDSWPFLRSRDRWEKWKSAA